MMMVLALGMSRPVSMMVVQTRTSNSPLTKPTMVSSRLRPGIWPWAIATRASGRSSCAFVGHGLNGLDPVVNHEDLAAALQFAQVYGFLDYQVRRIWPTKVLIGGALRAGC